MAKSKAKKTSWEDWYKETANMSNEYQRIVKELYKNITELEAKLKIFEEKYGNNDREINKVKKHKIKL